MCSCGKSGGVIVGIYSVSTNLKYVLNMQSALYVLVLVSIFFITTIKKTLPLLIMVAIILINLKLIFDLRRSSCRGET